MTPVAEVEDPFRMGSGQQERGNRNQSHLGLFLLLRWSLFRRFSSGPVTGIEWKVLELNRIRGGNKQSKSGWGARDSPIRISQPPSLGRTLGESDGNYGK